MAINKNFIIKNGLEVSEDVLYVDPSTEKVGIGLTIPSAKLTVSGDAYVTGLGTITTLNSTAATIGGVQISSGIVTATSFVGGGSNLSGIVTGIIAGDNISVSGSTGNVTITGIAATTNINADSLVVTGVSTLGVVTGATYYGDGSNLSGLISGVGVATASGLVGSGATILDFRGAGISTVTVSSGIATINITGGGGGGGTDPSYNSINVSGIATIGTVEISSGIITSTSGIVTYYGDGSNLTGSAPDFIAGSGISSDSIYVGTGVTLFNFIGGDNVTVDVAKSSTTADITINSSSNIDVTEINVSGVATVGVITGTASIGVTAVYAETLYGDASNVTGIVTFVDGGTNINVNGTTGIVTVNLNDIPNLLGINLTSGIATVPTLSATNGTITNLSGTAGTITTLDSTSGTITTLNSTSGTITNLTGTAATITTLNSTTGTITNATLTNATITNLTGTISTIGTIDVANATVTNISGSIGTYTEFNGTDLTFTNGTITNLTGTAGTITNGTITNLTGTAGTITNFASTNINASGIVTATGGFNLGISSAGTSVTSGPVTTLNFIGVGNTFSVDGTTINISIAGGELDITSSLFV